MFSVLIKTTKLNLPVDMQLEVVGCRVLPILHGAENSGDY